MQDPVCIPYPPIGRPRYWWSARVKLGSTSRFLQGRFSQHLHLPSIHEDSSLPKDGTKHALKKRSLAGEGNGKDQAYH